MAKLSFKVYLIYENSSEHLEVRRFGIDDDVATNYVYLREKLQVIFPQLRGWNFTITWRDEENENITISTNEELEIALSEISKNVNSNIFKLYVVLGDAERGKDVDAKKVEQTLHPGVVCDVCDKNICGFRFKCMQCADYDLCSDCMTLGYHPEHYIVRMTEPIEWSSYQGRRLAHHMRKFMKKVNNDERRYKNGRRGGSGNNNGSGGCPIFNTSGKFAVGPFDASVIDSLADFIADAYIPPSDEYAEQKRSKEQRRDPSTEAATEATENLQQEASKDKFSHLMKIFENNLSSISQFLDPLGISITVTDDRDSPKNVAKEKAEAQKPAESVNETVKKFPGKGKKLCDDNADEKTVSSEEVISQKEAVASCSAEQAAEAEEWTMVQRESTNNSCASSISSSLNGSVTPTAPEAVKSEPSKQSIYPSLPQEGKQFYHPNPKIQDAVEAMMAMGFSNEGGWLTHLLVSKNGDISQALDVLQPVRHH